MTEVAGLLPVATASPDEREGVRGLRVTIDLAPVGIAHFGLDGRFLLVNDRLCEILGRSRAQLLQLHFQQITYGDDVAHCIEQNRRLAAGEIPSYRLEKRFLLPGGRPVWTRVTVSAARDPGNEVAFFIGVAEDVTEQHDAEEARREAERARDEMVAIVAHDLRNPVHTITMGAAALLKGPLPAEQSDRLLRIIQRTAGGMEHLLNDLLDVSRIETRTFAVAARPVDILKLLDEAREMLDVHARERDIAFACEAPTAGFVVVGDHARLMQVLSNLVGNAIKFTPPGGRVDVRTRAVGKMLEISVEDSGTGVEAKLLANLFDRFWQADRTTRAGAGLGLPIAKGIVEAHGGRIWAESTPGQGTTVRFTVPLRDA